jgi:heterodisulfide reductase subunit A-like polyferredoxin
MAARVNTEACVGCATCTAECPIGAIAMNEENKAEINAALCVSCGSCASACPVHAIDL